MVAFNRRTALLGTLGLAGAGLAGCAPSATTTPINTSVPAGTASATPTAPVDTTPRWPLTGRVLKNADDAKRIAVMVKVPDNKNEHPQLGLQDADIIFVQLEGYPAAVGQSSTRLAPVFHSKYPEGVNPVRSIRPVDIPLLSPMTGMIASTGAYKSVVAYAAANSQYLISDKTYINTKGTGAYGILGSRVRTLNGQTYYDRAVLSHPAVLAKLAKRFTDGPQQSYFPWAASAAEVSTAVSGKKANKVVVPWKAGNTYSMTYDYDASTKRYLRSEPFGPHVYAGGIRATCDNVLVIRAKQLFSGITPQGKLTGGHLEPIHQITDAQGTFYYANRGAYVRGTWTKRAVNEHFQFTLADGSPLKMAPGMTYVELPNENAKVTIT